jgi:hypothetical protein
MQTLRELIRKNLLVEKKIAQLLDNMTITFSYDIDRTKHANLRSSRPELEDYNQKEITNGELVYILDLVKRTISEKILDGEIINGEPFIIKSPEKEIAIVIEPVNEIGQYWKLIIKTVFRESKHNPFRVGKDQLVIRI